MIAPPGIDVWMSSVSGYIQDIPLNRLPLPGSHDAISFPDINRRSQTQSLTIAQQLAAGYRYFDFRVKVNNGVYYGVHGIDATDHIYCEVKAGDGPYIFTDIKEFLIGRPEELVILSFSHFDAHLFQSFNHDDKLNFVDQVKAYFGSLLIPRSRTPLVTYGECMAANQQVLVLIEDDDDWYPSLNSNDRTDAIFFSISESVCDRYSDCFVDLHVGPPVTAQITSTLTDQELALRSRDMDKFLITQAILNYFVSLFDGMSQNWTGAKEMNPRFTHIYEYAWRQRSIDSHGYPPMPVPNVLLLDFVGEFDNFPEMCRAMLRPPNFPRKNIASGSKQILRNNYYGNYIHKPQESLKFWYGYVKPMEAGCEFHEIERVFGSGNIKTGDEVYIKVSLNGTWSNYLACNNSYISNKVWYENTDTPSDNHKWVITKTVSAKGMSTEGMKEDSEEIYERDMILLHNKASQKYLIPSGSFDYITVSDETSEATWMF